eukprot:3540521-Prymnesium_polylepis.4
MCPRGREERVSTGGRRRARPPVAPSRVRTQATVRWVRAAAAQRPRRAARAPTAGQPLRAAAANANAHAGAFGSGSKRAGRAQMGRAPSSGLVRDLPLEADEVLLWRGRRRLGCWRRADCALPACCLGCARSADSARHAEAIDHGQHGIDAESVAKLRQQQRLQDWLRVGDPSRLEQQVVDPFPLLEQRGDGLAQAVVYRAADAAVRQLDDAVAHGARRDEERAVNVDRAKLVDERADAELPLVGEQVIEEGRLAAA